MICLLFIAIGNNIRAARLLVLAEQRVTELMPVEEEAAGLRVVEVKKFSKKGPGGPGGPGGPAVTIRRFSRIGGLIGGVVGGTVGGVVGAVAGPVGAVSVGAAGASAGALVGATIGAKIGGATTQEALRIGGRAAVMELCYYC